MSPRPSVWNVIRRQTVVGWVVGFTAGVLAHIAHAPWLAALLLSTTCRVGMDVVYAWHDKRHPPPQEDAVVKAPET